MDCPLELDETPELCSACYCDYCLEEYHGISKKTIKSMDKAIENLSGDRDDSDITKTDFGFGDIEI